MKTYTHDRVAIRPVCAQHRVVIAGRNKRSLDERSCRLPIDMPMAVHWTYKCVQQAFIQEAFPLDDSHKAPSGLRTITLTCPQQFLKDLAAAMVLAMVTPRARKHRQVMLMVHICKMAGNSCGNCG